jgi:hypothetical protein
MISATVHRNPSHERAPPCHDNYTVADAAVLPVICTCTSPATPANMLPCLVPPRPPAGRRRGCRPCGVHEGGCVVCGNEGRSRRPGETCVHRQPNQVVSPLTPASMAPLTLDQSPCLTRMPPSSATLTDAGYPHPDVRPQQLLVSGDWRQDHRGGESRAPPPPLRK